MVSFIKMGLGLWFFWDCLDELRYDLLGIIYKFFKEWCCFCEYLFDSVIDQLFVYMWVKFYLSNERFIYL